MPTPVEITAYDPSWPDYFEKAARALAALLEEAVSSIDHVGSTSVPGIAAKPLIDIDITLHSASDIPLAAGHLESIGYEARGSRHGDGVWAFLLRGRAGEPGQRVYLCPPGSDTHLMRIAFRDNLRLDVDLAAAYQELKLLLAAKFPLDGDGYTTAKGEFIRKAIGTSAR